jgi:type IV pilus assembly protein PilO
LYFFFLHLPRAGAIAAKEEQLRGINAERAKLQEKLKDRPRLEQEIADVEASFNKAKSQLPEGKEIPELLNQVSNIGRESGLEIILFRQQVETLQELYAEVPVEMAVRGGYHQIALFFEKVRLLNRIVNVGNIGIKNPQTVEGQLQLEDAFFATTYRFLTEKEREEIEKKKAEEKKASGKSS